MPITRCKRYAFVPFLYDQDDARPREANNAILQEGRRLTPKVATCYFPRLLNRRGRALLFLAR
jgi:hypothetical protein